MNLQPSEKESNKLKSIADEIISKIKLKDASSILGGSAAKNTFLPGTKELDIYVKFNYEKYKSKSDKLSNILHAYLKRKFPRIARLHGSRDYFQIKYKGYTIEIIPILDIDNYAQAKNITDISPLHIAWVSKHINNLANDIRLAKKFCYAHNIYGAESYIKGFSGYVLEILVIHHGGFENLVKAAVKWKPGQVIDIYNAHKDVFSELNESKLSPLILIDPVQPDRNASAGLSDASYQKFIHLARKYSEHPSEELFKREEITKKLLSKKFKGKQIIMLNSYPKKAKPDVAGAKLLKCFQLIARQISNNEFHINASDFIFNEKAILYYVLDKKQLPKTKKHYGPPLDNEKHLQAFKKRWKGYKIYQEGNKAYVIIKRKYAKPVQLVKDLIKSKEVKNLASKIKII